MDYYERLSPNGYKLVSVYAAFLLLAASFTQVVTTLVLLKKVYRKKVLTPYFLSIVASNFLLLYGSLPTTFISSLKNGWAFNDNICYLAGFLSGVGSVSMIATVAVTTIKIYFLAKSRPPVNNQIKPDSSCLKVLLCVWTYSICALLPPVIGLTEMKVEGAGTNCTPNWSPADTNGIIYVVFLLAMSYIIPVSISSVCLVKTRRLLSINEANYNFINLCFKNLKHINKMCTLAVIFFTTAWLPYAIIVVLCIFGKKSFISVEIEMGPTLLAKTSALFNPFIYAIVNPRFRKSVLQLLNIKLLLNCNKKVIEIGNLKENRVGNIDKTDGAKLNNNKRQAFLPDSKIQATENIESLASRIQRNPDLEY